MSKFSPESSSQQAIPDKTEIIQRHRPELFQFSQEAEEAIARKINLLKRPQISDEELASILETHHLSVEELIARAINKPESEENT